MRITHCAAGAFFSATIAIVAASLGTGCQRVQQDAPKDTLIYVLAGQSNMAGRGIVEPQDTVSNPRILSFEGDGTFAVKSEPNTLNQGWLAGLDCGKSFGAELLN